MKPATKDALMDWLVCLLPQFAARWLWNSGLPLGPFAPYVLGRSFGSPARRMP